MMCRERQNRIWAAGIAISVWCLAWGMPAWSEPATLAEKCAEAYQKTKKCPEALCELACADEGEGCAAACLPRACPDITAKDCPEEYCAVMEDCSGEKVCHHQMVGERPECGDLAYAGQDVDCCQGMVRRCGVEFLDGSCDMEGRNSVYSLPICIPCGDGLCGQFEDACNCPEDCKRP